MISSILSATTMVKFSNLKKEEDTFPKHLEKKHPIEVGMKKI